MAWFPRRSSASPSASGRPRSRSAARSEPSSSPSSRRPAARTRRSSSSPDHAPPERSSPRRSSAAGERRTAGDRGHFEPVARPAHVAPRPRNRPLPHRADRRSPASSSSSSTTNGTSTQAVDRARRDLRARDRRAHQLGTDLRPARQPARPAARHRHRPRGFTAAVAAATGAPLALLIPLFVVAGVLSMSWNGLAYAAAAEAAGTRKTGAALGFQQTLLGVVVAGAPALSLRSRRTAGAPRSSSPPPARRSAFRPLAAQRTRANTRNVGDPAGNSPNSGLRQPSSFSRCRNVDCTPDWHIGSGARSARTAPNPSRLRSPCAQEIDVDLRLVDLLEAAHVRVPVLLVRVHERARASQARSGIDDLLAVHLAEPALRLVLRMERERRRGLLGRHADIVRAVSALRKT